MYKFVPILLIVLGVSTAFPSDWPHWRGATRNDVVEEPSHWSGEGWGARVLWQKDVGRGSTSPLVVDGRIYTMGFEAGQDSVLCLDAVTGDEIWRASYPSRDYGRHATGDQSLYSGVTSTPEFDPPTGLLYTLGTDGDLHCWDTAAQGRKVWGLNLYESFDVPQRPKVGRSGQRDYGYTSSPLVMGDWLIVEVGSRTGNLIAFDKRNGRPVWASKANPPAGHNGGPVPMTVQGVSCIAVQTHDGLLVVRTDRGREGETVAQWPWATDYANNIATAAVHEDNVLLTSAYNQHKLVRLRITLRGAQQVWEHHDASGICTPLVHQGCVYWAWRGVKCIDFETGRPRWQGGRVGDAGSCIATSDDRLMVWANRGDLLLVETAERSPDRYAELAVVKDLARDDVWPHGVLAEGRFYGKDRQGRLVCLDLRPDGPVSPALLASRESPPASNSVGSGDTPVAATPDRPEPSPATDRVHPVPSPNVQPWQDDRDEVVFAWDRTFGPRIHGPGDRPADWKFKARNGAKAGPGGSLDLTRGAAVVQGADETLLAAFTDESQITLEVIFTAANATQTGPARLVSFSTDAYSRNFTLAQEGDSLWLRLRTTRTGTNGMSPEVRLCPVAPGKRQHVIVSYHDGRLIGYLDGQPVLDTTTVQGDFSNWTPQHLIIGDEWNGDRDWSGTVERVAVYRRAVGQDAGQASRAAAHSPRSATIAAAGEDPDRYLVQLQQPTANRQNDQPVDQPAVRLMADGKDESAGDLPCYRIVTPVATYCLEKTGAGLSSLIDRDGLDWLSFHPQPDSGAAGEYRGFPNAVHQQGGNFFHAGNTGENGSVTKIEYQGNDRVSISATSRSGHWSCRYDFYADRCTFTMTRMPEQARYWVLYEGTPGGEYHDDDWWMTSAIRAKQPLTKPHEEDIPAPEWIAFGDRQVQRALVLIHHEDDRHPDRFYQMHRQMTVFGFGRSGLNKYLDRVPQSVTILLTDSTAHDEIDGIARKAIGMGQDPSGE